MKIKSLCYLLSILITLFIAGMVFSQETDIPNQSNPDATVIVPESPEAPPAEVQPPADTTTGPDAEDQKSQDDQTKKTTQSKQAAVQSTAAAASVAAATTGELALGSTTFVAPPSPDNSTFTGAAGYSVPIIVPPGRNGLAPKIALTYNSQRGNSWVGVGWDIDLGAIRRSTKRAVDYSKNDFVFSSAGQSYDLVGRTNVWGANYYGAKAEEDFSKYYLSNNSWVVTAKDGTKYYFGSTDASRQFSGNNIFQWYLDKVEDTNGNYISITYATYPTTDPGQLYPLEIKYTGHVSGLQPTNSIKFILEDRTDKILSYVPHFKTLMTKRLQAVEVYAGTAFVRKYVLAHSSSPTNHRTLAQSVTEIGSDGTSSLPPITFTYQNGGETGIDSFTKLPKYYGWLDQLMGVVGVNGSKTVNTTTGDQNGDGLADIYYEVRWEHNGMTSDSGAFLVSQGNGEFNTIASTNRVFSGPDCLNKDVPGNATHDCQARTLGDINGDGKVEFIERPIDSDPYQPFSALDINGDGYADLYFEECRVYKFPSDQGGVPLDYIAQPYFQLGKGDGTLYPSHIPVPFPSCAPDPNYQEWCSIPGHENSSYCKEKCKTMFGDFNGDGILDIIFIPAYTYWQGSATLYFGKGDGTFDPVTITDANLKEAVAAIDINNDGFADLRLSDQKFLIGKGNGTFESSPTNFETDTGFLSSGGAKYIFGDFDGDGRQDLLTPGGIYFANAKPYPDLLSGVINTMGGKAFITYVPSTKFQSPSQNLPFPVQVVETITLDDGLGNHSGTTYTYSGGLYDHREREFQGFASVTKINPDGSKEVTQFNQDYYLKAKPKLTQLIAPAINGGSETLLSQTTITWDTVALSSGVTFVKLSQKRTESYDAETVFSQEVYTYDDTNGNLLSTESTGTDAEKVTKTNLYENKGFWTWRTIQEALKDSTNAVLRQTDYVYENNTGNLISKTAWLQGGDSPLITYQYDTYGNVLKEFDAKGNPPIEVVYETQAYTYPQYIYNPLRHWVEYEVDPRYGYAKKKIDRSNNNNTITYTYDLFGRLTLTQNPDGGETRVTYYDTAFPRYTLIEVKEAGNSYIPTYGYYDGFGRSIQVSALGENNNSIITQTFYDNMGRANLTNGPFFGSGMGYPQTAPSTGYPLVWTSYDFRGRPVTVKSKQGDHLQNDEYITISFAYSGFKTTVTDPDGSKKLERKDYLGRIIRVREYVMDNGTLTQPLTYYAYNAAGDLLKVTDSQGNITTLIYDTLGHKREMTDPDMGRWTYNYDKNGNLTNQFDAKGQEIRFTYDPLNRVLSKNYYINGQLSTVDSPVTCTYDNSTTGANGIGKPYTSTKGNIVITNNKYDSMSRILKVTKRIDTTDYVTQNQYDLSGKVTKLTYPGSDAYFITYAYYPGSNLIYTITDSNQVVQTQYTDYAATGKIGQITYPNGIYTFYTYDAWSTKLFGIVTTNDPDNTDPTKDLQNREYTYSRAGDILQIKDNAKGITYDYTYDMLHRLTGETLSGTGAPVATKVETITLDYSGTTGPVHGVKTITLNGVSRTCQYDANGNMTTSPDFSTPANPLNRAIAYDADNMPITIAHANGTTVNFVYDSVDKRTKKLVQGGKTVLYLGDHYEVENGVGIKYIFGGNLRLAQIKGSLTSYFHKDHLGSTAAITDQTGTKVEGATYEPFGSTRMHEGTDTSAYKFTDQELDNETNLYNYDARLYDPVLGMFVTPDSIVPDMYDPQTLNRYSYCRNNPLIYTDPSGHTLKDPNTNSNNGAPDDPKVSPPCIGNDGDFEPPPDKRNIIVKGYEIARGYLARRHREIELKKERELNSQIQEMLDQILGYSFTWAPDCQWHSIKREVALAIRELGMQLGADQIIINSAKRTDILQDQLYLESLTTGIQTATSKTSYHCQAKGFLAADVRFFKDGKQISIDKVAETAANVSAIGCVGTYQQGFNHIDLRARINGKISLYE